MTAAPVPCPVCGRAFPVTENGRIGGHSEPASETRYKRLPCRGSHALAPAGDLFPDAPTVATIPAPGVPLDLFTEGA